MGSSTGCVSREEANSQVTLVLTPKISQPEPVSIIEPLRMIHKKPILEKVQNIQPDEDHSLFLIMKNYNQLLKFAEASHCCADNNTVYSHSHFLRRSQNEFQRVNLFTSRLTKSTSNQKNRQTRSQSSQILSNNNNDRQLLKSILKKEKQQKQKKGQVSEAFRASKSVHFKEVLHKVHRSQRENYVFRRSLI